MTSLVRFPIQPCIRRETLTVNTNIINTVKPPPMSCVQSTVRLECFTVLSNDFAKHRATYHSQQLSAPSEGLSTLMPIHENSAEMREAGTGRCFPHNAAQLLRFTATACFTPGDKRYTWTLANLQRCPGNQPDGHFPISHAPWAASKADTAKGIIDWLVQLCPYCDPQTSYFLSRCITLLSLASVWKVWTWPGRWKSVSNYLAIQWERTLRHQVSDPVKLMAGKESATNEGSGLLEVGVRLKSHRLRFSSTIQRFGAVRLLLVKWGPISSQLEFLIKVVFQFIFATTHKMTVEKESVCAIVIGWVCDCLWESLKMNAAVRLA